MQEFLRGVEYVVDKVGYIHDLSCLTTYKYVLRCLVAESIS